MPTAGLPGSKRSPNTAGQFPSGRPFINPRRSTTGNALNGWNKTSPRSRSSQTLERETSLFFLPGDYPSRQRIRTGRTSPDVMLPLYAPVSGAAGPISAPVGESGDPPHDCRAQEGSGIRFPTPCQLSLRFCGSFRPVAIGVTFILLSPCIWVHTDDGGTMADPCD